MDYGKGAWTRARTDTEHSARLLRTAFACQAGTGGTSDHAAGHRAGLTTARRVIVGALPAPGRSCSAGSKRDLVTPIEPPFDITGWTGPAPRDKTLAEVWAVMSRTGAQLRPEAERPHMGVVTEGPRHEVHDHDVRRPGRRDPGPLTGVDRRHASAADE